MAITRPVTKTIISTTAFGVPVADEINEHDAWIAANTPTAWVPLSLLNGWVSHVATPAYRKIGDIVYLRGNVKNGTDGSNMFTMPAGVRPIDTVEVVVFAYYIYWDFSTVTIRPTGETSAKYHTGTPPSLAANLGLWQVFYALG